MPVIGANLLIGTFRLILVFLYRERNINEFGIKIFFKN
ncbi:hypothetical protein ASZ90_004649 [hydrocarbon metagenome]|uniref:Uncharacterized protein n=1 Tax=hydrocarbon metagenome TaxID=938273 RepID=A0A0W8FXG7_9ZZZZ